MQTEIQQVEFSYMILTDRQANEFKLYLVAQVASPPLPQPAYIQLHSRLSKSVHYKKTSFAPQTDLSHDYWEFRTSTVTNYEGNLQVTKENHETPQ